MTKATIWTRDFIIITAVNFLIAANFYLLMVVMARFAMYSFDVGEALGGFAASSFVLGALIARLFSGRLISTYKPNVVLFASLGVNLLITLAYVACASYVLLIVVRLIHGAAFGIGTTTTLTIASKLLPPRRRGEGIGYFSLSQTLATAIGPFIALSISADQDFRPVFLTCFSTIAMAIGAMVLLGYDNKQASTPRTNSAQARSQTTNTQLRRPTTTSRTQLAHSRQSTHEQPRNTQNHAAQSHRTRQKSQQTSQQAGRAFSGAFAESFSGTFTGSLEGAVMPISLVSLVMYLCYSALVSFMSGYSISIGLQDSSSIFFVVYALAVLASRPLAGRIFDRQGAAFVLYPAFGLFVVGMVLFSASTNSHMLLIAAAILGVGFGSIQLGTQASAVKQAPKGRLAHANATYLMLSDIGMALGPMLMGLLIGPYGYRGMYIAVAIIAAVCMVLYRFIGAHK
ncbi:MAG: MFS transporter [Atopobiaceae bacterium]|nr:MFS transporter [Atopobiaceae bacterium]